MDSKVITLAHSLQISPYKALLSFCWLFRMVAADHVMYFQVLSSIKVTDFISFIRYLRFPFFLIYCFKTNLLLQASRCSKGSLFSTEKLPCWSDFPSLSKHWRLWAAAQVALQNPPSSVKGLPKSMTFNQSSVRKVLMNKLSKLEGTAAGWLTLICALALKLIKMLKP